jgi:hypothetical protein
MNEIRFIDYTACLISIILFILILLIITNESSGKILYDGHRKKFNIGTSLDVHGSIIKEVISSPKLNNNYIRIILFRDIVQKNNNYRDNLSVVGYGFNNWKDIDISRYKKLLFIAKANKQSYIFITLVDNISSGHSVQLKLNNNYAKFEIPLSYFGNKLNYKKITTLLFHSELESLSKLTVDIDNIEVI